MAPILQGKKIVLGVSASIAAYKSADIVSSLVELGAEVYTVLTREAPHFVSPLVLEVLSRHCVEINPFQTGRNTIPAHIELADKADLLLIAPATAHLLALLANAHAPDSLTALYLATTAPVLIAPAMNGNMLSHPALQTNLQRLKEYGVLIIEPQQDGLLACGYQGAGKLAQVDHIIQTVCQTLESPKT